MTICRHCRRNRAGKSRGLCSSCWGNPEVRALYPSALERMCGRCRSRRLPMGAAPDAALCRDCTRGRPVPPRIEEAERLLPTTGTGPTSAAPGCAERLATIIARHDAKVPLWDKRDTVELE